MADKKTKVTDWDDDMAGMKDREAPPPPPEEFEKKAEPAKPDTLADVVGDMFLFMNGRHQSVRPHENSEITKLMARLRALKEKA